MKSCKELGQGLPDILNDLDDLQFQIACTLNALDAVHTAMSCGDYKAETYLDGLFEMHNHLNKLNLEIKGKLAEARVIQKAEKAETVT